MFWAPADGFATQTVAEVYGVEADGGRPEIDARTGCVGCNLASRDIALERLVTSPDWAYLRPLMRLRALYADLRAAGNRLRKAGIAVGDQGDAVYSTQRMGPLTLDARRWGLQEVLAIQSEVNEHCGDHPPISLIDAAEHARIVELIDAGTWPNGWDGTEPVGDAWLPVRVTRDGGVHYRLPLFQEA